MLGVAVLVLLGWCGVACSGGSVGTSDPAGKPVVVNVPGDSPTITAALQKVADDGLVLVHPGNYPESVTVEVPGVTIRGSDRNAVVIDGQGVRSSGLVVSAPGVTISNLTVENHTFYGVLVTGDPGAARGPLGSGYTAPDPGTSQPVQRFRVDHVTAVNNGLYGIYAFYAQHGVILDSYASGSADSGFYVGQCRECDIVVRGNVAERNAVGFENANASDSVYILENRWSGNRVGVTLISSYQEALTPQRGNTVVGNVVTNNTSGDSPTQADGGFGIGVGISGGRDNVVQRNLITGNPRAGVLINGAEDLPATGNQLLDNVLDDNGVDVADVSSEQTPSSGNCVSPGDVTALPQALAAAACPAGSATSAGAAARDLPTVAVPPGVSFLDVRSPRPQPSLEHTTDTPAASLPATVGPPDLSTIMVPSADYLAALTGTS